MFRFPRAARRSLFGLNHILGQGQSLAEGALGDPVLSAAQPFDNLTFTDGVINSVTYSSLIDLVESGVETMSSGLANLVTDLAADLGLTHDALVSIASASGTAYRGLKKGQAAYTRAMAQVSGGRTRALALGKTHGVTATTCVHGEQDGQDYNGGGSGPNPAYDVDLVEWQADLEEDIQAITGQTGIIPMLHSQMSAIAGSDIPLAQLRAHLANPGRIILVCPKYFLPNVDGSHLTNHGYRRLGEYYAKVYQRAIVERGTWEPLRPLTAVRVGNVITVTFKVPQLPLVFDNGTHGAATDKGFDVVGGGSIVSVADPSGDTVAITVSGTVTRIRYAQLASSKGNLRDSDASVESRHGYDLSNWCCHFDIPVT